MLTVMSERDVGLVSFSHSLLEVIRDPSLSSLSLLSFLSFLSFLSLFFLFSLFFPLLSLLLSLLLSYLSPPLSQDTESFVSSGYDPIAKKETEATHNCLHLLLSLPLNAAMAVICHGEGGREKRREECGERVETRWERKEEGGEKEKEKEEEDVKVK